MLYYTIQLYDGESEFIGFEIFNVAFDPIKSRSYISEPVIKSNYFNKEPQESYYLVLMLTEKDAADGFFKMKSFRLFENQFNFD